jgi:predicted lysophospholipase L1 biosynthesis ABC-type transport system permease subunit
MAQTKRKRRSKHRGTPAGTIEARGRTSRPASPEERKKQSRAQAREKRLNQQPTWRNSIMRAGFAAALLFIFLLVTAKGKDKVVTAVLFTAIALAIYVPAGYYIELFLWRRRQKRGASGGAK